MKKILHNLCFLGAWLFSMGISQAQVTISYSQAFYCQDGFNPSPTITGTTGGSFAAGAGLILDSTTGVVDLSASLVGSYTITYTYTGGSTSTNLQIVAREDASVSYTTLTYCPNNISDTPTVATPGGRFRYIGSGFLCLDTLSGLINGINCGSIAGTYTVFYTTNGACPSTSSRTITILNEENALFDYPSTRNYCQNDADPSPILLGNTNGYFTSVPALALNSITGAIDLSATPVGSYVVTYTTTGPCPNAYAVPVNIRAADDAQFSYANVIYCQQSTDPIPTIGGLAGGSFSSSDSNLVLNATTGAIDLDASPIGLYAITYTTNGQCPNSSTFTVRIDSLDDAGFVYDTTNFCQNGGLALPTITGETGGSFFSIPFGLALNSSTGAIDLANSEANNFTVIYTTPNPCSNSSSFSIDIDSVPAFIFDYPLDTYCTNDFSRPGPVPLPSFGFGSVSAASGLSLGGNGSLVLEQSTPGVYEVTYINNPINNFCQVTYKDTITVLPADNASFSYGAVRFCVGDPPITPFVINNTGGMFTADNGLTISASTGTIDFATVSPGFYTITYTTAGYCSNSFSQAILIDSFPDASFSYATNSYCLGAANPRPIITGITGGQFSSSVGLTINPFSGEIDLMNSAAGTYQVFYSLTTSCSATDSTTVVLWPEEDASFSYPKATYCQNEAPAVPNIITTGGNFSSSPSGLAYNINAGIVDLANSIPGTYTLTYTTTGNCPDTSSQTLTVEALPSAAFSYPQSIYCKGTANPIPIITGTTGGTFSADNNLPIDRLLGQVDLLSANAGAYTVTYSISNTACMDTSSVGLVIALADTASFGYTDTVVCVNGGNNIVLGASGSTTGIYSASPVGVVFANPSTGEIDVPNTTAGTYVVSYMTTGACPDTASINLVATFCLGIEELVENNRYNLYPNPNTGSFYITHQGEEQTVDVRVVDVLGKRIYEETGVNFYNNNYFLQLPPVPAGTYWVVVESPQGIWHQKMVVAQP